MGIDRLRTLGLETKMANTQRADVGRRTIHDVAQIRQGAADRDKRMSDAENYEASIYTPEQHKKDVDEGIFDFYTFADENPEATPEQLARKYNEKGDHKAARIYRGRQGGLIVEDQYGGKTVVTKPKINAMRKYHAGQASVAEAAKRKENAAINTADRISKRQFKLQDKRAAAKEYNRLKKAGAVKYDPNNSMHNSKAMRIVEVGKRKLVIPSETAARLDEEDKVLHRSQVANKASRDYKLTQSKAKVAGAGASLSQAKKAVQDAQARADSTSKAVEEFTAGTEPTDEELKNPRYKKLIRDNKAAERWLAAAETAQRVAEQKFASVSKAANKLETEYGASEKAGKALQADIDARRTKLAGTRSKQAIRNKRKRLKKQVGKAQDAFKNIQEMVNKYEDKSLRVSKLSEIDRPASLKTLAKDKANLKRYTKHNAPSYKVLGAMRPELKGDGAYAIKFADGVVRVYIGPDSPSVEEARNTAYWTDIEKYYQ